MTTQQAREIFNQAANTAIAKGDKDAAANIELCREYFTNPTFRRWMENHVAALNGL